MLIDTCCGSLHSYLCNKVDDALELLYYISAGIVMQCFTMYTFSQFAAVGV